MGTPGTFGVRLAILCVSSLALAVPAAAQSPKPPANEDCLACHGDADAKRADGRSIFVAAQAFDASTHGGASCVDCHKDLATIAEFPHPERLAKVNCASCHDDVGVKYHDSIHWRARDKAGLVVAPSCADCHGKHDIRAKAGPQARVFRANIPATCGGCHAGIREHYDSSVHAAALKSGNPKAPVCIDCHTAHDIQRADTDAWRAAVTKECGGCHAESQKTYRDTFHGQVTSLGYQRVATCADCHGSHDIKPKKDAQSRIAPAHLVETCRQCHAGANENFVKYDPHADRHSKARSPVLFYAGRFMDGLLLGVFGFFGLHTALWLRRGVKARGEIQPAEKREEKTA